MGVFMLFENKMEYFIELDTSYYHTPSIKVIPKYDKLSKKSNNNCYKDSLDTQDYKTGLENDEAQEKKLVKRIK